MLFSSRWYSSFERCRVLSWQPTTTNGKSCLHILFSPHPCNGYDPCSVADPTQCICSDDLQSAAEHLGWCSRLSHDIHHQSPGHHTKQYQTTGFFLVSTDPSHQSTHSIFFSNHLRGRSLDDFHPRSLQVIASDKCHQLASALRSMTTKVPYEDVQTAATHITQCAMNALTVSHRQRLQVRHRSHRSNAVVGSE